MECHLDERRLERSYDSRVCVSCVHFAHGVDSHCRTLVACQLHRGQLQQGDHLTRRCEHSEVGYGGCNRLMSPVVPNNPQLLSIVSRTYAHV